MDHQKSPGHAPKQRWNGRTEFEVVIPELGRISRLVLTETICFTLAVVVLSLSIIIFLLSRGFDRSDIGAIFIAGIILIGLLAVVVTSEMKISALGKIADEKFNNSIISNLNIYPINGASIFNKKCGYIHMKDEAGLEISMWELFYFTDRPDTISVERFSIDAFDRYREDGTIKVAS